MFRNKGLFWIVLSALIFLRPFISEAAFPFLGFFYNFSLVISGLFFICQNQIYKKILFSRLDYFVFLFVVGIFFSLSFSRFAFLRLSELFFFLPNLIIFLIASRLNNAFRARLLKVIFCSAVLISIYAIYQYFWSFRHIEEYIRGNPADLPYAPDYLMMILKRRRAFGTFISSNVYAGYLLMLIFIGAGLLMDLRAKSRKFDKGILALILGMGLLVVALFLTKSLFAIICFVIAAVIFGGLVLIYYLGYFKRNAIKVSACILIFALFLSCLFFVFARQRIAQLADFSDLNNSLVQRWYYWHDALKMIKANPLIGVGWGNFEWFYNYYRLPGANYSRYAHNLFLQVCAETGIIGLMAILGVIALFFKNGFNAIRKRSREFWLDAGLFFSGSVFLLHNLSDIGFYFAQSAFFWWMILGFLNKRREDKICICR